MESKPKYNSATISQLSDHELREALKTYSEKPGPITDSTRNIYRKKLLSLAQSKNNAFEFDDDDDDDETSDEDFVVQDESDESDSEEDEEEDESDVEELNEKETEELLRDLEKDSRITHQSTGYGRLIKAVGIVFLSIIALYAYKEKHVIQKFIPILFFSIIFYCIYWIAGYFRRRSQSHSQKVCKLVAEALELLQSPENPKGMMPVLHIRDTLLNPTERKNKKHINLWNECVKFVEHHESRVKVEMVNVEGEDFKAWKWIGPRK